ncbi:hypothetical protein BIW11_11358 [Tropilaelaps mercedesae]|uniref:Uncharacterized protein n=1 Tax=Tropilaelaps mercedesae TaxID=418985 RepID=A0A1V9XBF5_9ACAR|nr:hypothetical protein BIW11_11358 [Tropilaelaps mercedesae]
MRAIQKSLRVTLCCAMLCAWSTTHGCALAPPDGDGASSSDTGSGEAEPDTGSPSLQTAAMEEGSSASAEVTNDKEKDIEALAISESRKDWVLAIEKARKALKESSDDYKSTANADMRVTDLKEEQDDETKLKKYQIALRVNEKLCAVTVKQELDDKYTVQERDGGGKVECSVTSSEEE